MKIFRNIFIIFVIITVIVCITIAGVLLYQKNKTVYYAEDFGIETLISQTDYDQME